MPLKNLTSKTVILATVLLSASLTLANGREDIFGAGARAKALGSAGTALGNDYSALYYNPANLALNDSNSLSIVLSRIDYQLFVKDDAGDIETDPLHARDTVSLGITMDLPYNFAFGAMLNFGLDKVQFFEQSTPDSLPRFALYGQNLEQMSFMFGFAHEPIEGLSIGAAVAPLVNSDLKLTSVVPIYDSGEEVAAQFAWNLQPNTTYYLGLSYQANDKFRFGLSYRTEMFHRLDSVAAVNVDLTGVWIPFDLLLQSFSWYSPEQVSLGLTARPWQALLITADVTWYRWSGHPGPYVHSSPKPGSAVAEGLDYPPLVNIDFEDTLLPRLGIEWEVANPVDLRLGYRFHKTPAPLPSERVNLLDNDTHFLSTGLAYSLRLGDQEDRYDLHRGDQTPFDLSIEVYGTLGLMNEGQVDKKGAEPALNQYTFGGHVYDIGLSVSAHF